MRGNPNLESALRVVESLITGESEGNRLNVQDYVVMFTRRLGTERTVTAVNNLKARGARVIGVGEQTYARER